MDSQRKKAEQQYWKQSAETKTTVWEGICDGVKHEVVSGFMIADGSLLPKGKSPCVIIHIPTGRWAGFNLPYEIALEKLRTQPDSHSQVLDVIYSA